MFEVRYYIDYLKSVGKSVLETLPVILHHDRDSNIHNLHDEPVSLFFIFSLGRSGTQFFSRLLNIDPKAIVVHEPLRRDFFEYSRSFNHNYNYNYNEYMRFRIKYIQYRTSHRNIQFYGEVNSALRRHCSALMANMPNAKGLFLIRDGRDVVRSMMSRRAMSSNWFYNRISPQHGDPYFKIWQSMNNFEKCCWVWSSENMILYKQFGPALKFELLLKDYNYFKLNMLDVLGLKISEDIWEAERTKKSANRTQKYLFEQYENWCPKQKGTFWEICGDMMQKHGYCRSKGEID